MGQVKPTPRQNISEWRLVCKDVYGQPATFSLYCTETERNNLLDLMQDAGIFVNSCFWEQQKKASFAAIMKGSQ